MHRTLAIATLVLLAGCEAAAAAGASCARASDCAAPLVCTFGRCHVQCADVRDCPIGARCIANAGGPVCSISIENHCSTDVCPAPLTCVDDQCRTVCTSAADCLAGACEGTTCAEPVSGLDAGMPNDAAVARDAAQTDAFVAPDAFAPFDAGPPCVGAGCANRVVISEVFPDSGGAAFVELYVPSAAGAVLDGCVVDLTDHVGAHITTTIVSATVPSHGFLLVGGASVPARDVVPTAMFVIENAQSTAQLICDTTTIDTVGWGPTNFHDTASAPAPGMGHSIERKASTSSTATSLGPGGSEEHAGNGYDTDDNATDFVEQPSPSPQSSASPLEP